MLADEQLHADRALKLGDRAGNGGLRDPQSARRLRDVPAISGGDHVAQNAQRNIHQKNLSRSTDLNIMVMQEAGSSSIVINDEQGDHDPYRRTISRRSA